MSVGHWDYFASLGVRGAAVGSERREEGQGISRHLTSASLGKDDLKMGGKDVMICSSVAARVVVFLCRVCCTKNTVEINFSAAAVCRYNIFMKVFGSSYSNLEDIRHPFDKGAGGCQK